MFRFPYINYYRTGNSKTKYTVKKDLYSPTSNNIHYNSNNKMFKNNTDKKEADFIFQLLGIKLKLDDLIILFLLYTLYSEKSCNSDLFIILILLFIT